MRTEDWIGACLVGLALGATLDLIRHRPRRPAPRPIEELADLPMDGTLVASLGRYGTGDWTYHLNVGRTRLL